MKLALLFNILYFCNGFLIIYHLYQSNATGRDYLTKYYGMLKGFITIILIFLYFSLENHPEIQVVLYLIFGCLGDVLLNSYDFNVYVFGGIFFCLSHVILIYYFKVNWKLVPLKLYLWILPGFLLHALFLYPSLFKIFDIQAITFFLYSIILEIAAASSIARGYKTNIDLHFIITAIGYFIYLLSDFFLLYKEITKIPTDVKYYIMSTYIIAQYMVVYGLIKQEKLKPL